MYKSDHSHALSIGQFKSLPVPERSKIVWEHGKFLAMEEDQHKKRFYYAYSDHYVELVMRECQMVTEVTPFREGDRFEKLRDIVDVWAHHRAPV